MLELPKCSYHFLYFDYKPDGTPIPRGDQVRPSLTIKSPTNEPVDIPSTSRCLIPTKLSVIIKPLRGKERPNYGNSARNNQHSANVLRSVLPPPHKQAHSIILSTYHPYTYSHNPFSAKKPSTTQKRNRCHPYSQKQVTTATHTMR
jgi:hypothetical protein